MQNEQKHPNPLIDPLLPVIQAQALITAVKLGIFERIGRPGCSINSLSENLGLQIQGLKKLLQLLCSMGYLELREKSLTLTEVARQTLLSDSPFHLTGWVEFCRLQHQVITGMEEVVRTGRPYCMKALLATAENRRIHQKGMADTARPAADKLAELIPVKDGAGRILDIGGSHGLYSAAICRKHPPMRGDVLELSDTIEEAKETAQQEGTTDIITHIEGNILSDKLKKDYDVVFMGNLVHHFSPDQNRSVFNKAASALSRGGTLAVWDIQDMDGMGTEEDTVGASFSLFFYLTSGTACYSLTEISDWLEEAGFVDIQIHDRVGGGTTHLLVTARKSKNL